MLCSSLRFCFIQDCLDLMISQTCRYMRDSQLTIRECAAWSVERDGACVFASCSRWTGEVNQMGGGWGYESAG